MRRNGIAGIRDRAEVQSRENGEAGGSRPGKARADESQLVSEELVKAERANLVAQKQAELAVVLDSHDALVRQMFHLDHFVLMTEYDPKEPRVYGSPSFQNYKANYDLVGKAVDSSPSRATRRSREEQVQLLKPPISAPCSPDAPMKIKEVSSPLSPIKIKGKSRPAELRTPAAQSVALEPRRSQNIPRESISAVPAQQDLGKRHDEDAVSHSLPAKKRRAFHSRPGELPVTAGRKSVRLNQVTASSDATAENARVGVANQLDSGLSNLPISSRMHKSKDTVVPNVSSPPKFNIKRVKLLVRRPPPLITNPQQRPPQARYNSSVHTFLSSYFALDHKDINESSLAEKTHAHAQILERAGRLQMQGRFIPDYDVFNPNDDVGEAQRRTKDHWDYVVEAACHLRSQWEKRISGPQTAGHVAKLIRGYWDGQEARKEKHKIQEERRLRNLAKATIRMVTDEWKKAVFHIREQERLKLEAEEARRRRAHLDAILDQSGQLLETQQGDLIRGDFSRSRSGSLSVHDWTTDDDDHSQIGEDSDVGSAAGESANDQETDEGGMELTEPLEEGIDGSSDIDGSESNADVPTDIDEDANTHMLLGNMPYDTSSGTLPDDPQPSSNPYISDERSKQNESFDPVEESINGSPRLTSSTLAGFSTTATEVEEEPFYQVSYGTPSDRIPEGGLEEDHGPHPRSQSPFSRQLDDEIREQESFLERTVLTYPTSPRISTSPRSSVSDTPNATLQSSAQPISANPALDDTSSEGFEEPSSLPFDLHPPHLETDVTSPSLSLSAEAEETSNGEKSVPTEESLAVHEPYEEPHATAAPEQETSQGDTQDDAMALNIPDYLKPFAVAPVEWKLDTKVTPPLLLRGVLRPYQQSGLEWLASLHTNNLNGILADEMGLGKTIQTIALLAHLACDRGIWGPHLIIVPTSVLLNWEMEFKKFLPGFKVLSYHGATKRRKELRQGWNDKYHFNVCITSYALASRDAHIFKRKPWYYMVLDEAHMIRNFKSQRWNILLMFRSFRRLLLTGTPLQNNLTELWALLQFLMSGNNFATLKDFADWFSNPLEKAIEMGNTQDEDTIQRVTKLHTVLRPYLLRRLKSDVEKELPSKYEHLVVCPLSKRQRFLYDEFMARSHTREALQSGVYQKIANVLMQLRKVCNHPNLFEVRPIVTSLAMERSAIADFEIKELLIRRRMLESADDTINFGVLGLNFISTQDKPLLAALETRRLDASSLLPFSSESPGTPPTKDFRTISGFKKYSAYVQRAEAITHWSHIRYLNGLRCKDSPLYSSELLNFVKRVQTSIVPSSSYDTPHPNWEDVRIVNALVKSYELRAEDMAPVIDRFAFATPAAVSLDLPRFTFPGYENLLFHEPPAFDSSLHRASVKLQIAFPDPSLLQYDCGKLQKLASLLREKKAGGHRILIFTQMTKILDILEIFLNHHGYLYLRLDGATKIEDRQYITERFNADPRIFCFIASSRSGGVGINLTGADTVVFYDSDFNPQMDRQCEDRAHRIGQIRDVHIYRFVSQHTVEEALLRKANQKRFLDDLVIQKGEFDWRSLFNDESALSKALEEFEDTEDVRAAAIAATEEVAMQGADEADFGGDVGESVAILGGENTQEEPPLPRAPTGDDVQNEDPQAEDEGGSVVEYMIGFAQQNWEFFKEWRL